MSSNIFLAGAFDRFNFGDLLFPLITREALRRLGIEAKIHVFATRESDLRRAGALPTLSLSNLGEKISGPNDTLVLAGGEILDARWAGTLAALTSPSRAFALKVLSKGLPLIADRWSQGRLRGTGLTGADRPLPWVWGPQDLPTPVRVVYNGIGGSGIDSLPPKLQAALRARLNRASYLSVRDPKTQKHLQDWDLAGPVHLAPDPAALMAEFFPWRDLDQNQDAETLEMKARFSSSGYIAVQLGRYAARGAIPAISQELRRIHQATSLGFVFVPLGQAAGHEDRQALESLRKSLPDLPCVVARAETLFEILWTIGGSRLFMGTSLHGNLTALAYQVPRVGLGSQVRKLDLFLKTWDSSQPHGCAPFDDFAERAQQQLVAPGEERKRDSERIVRESWKNFEAMAQALQWPRRAL